MVLVVLSDIEIYRAFALIGIAVGKYLLDKLYLLYDMPGGMRLNAWR